MNYRNSDAATNAVWHHSISSRRKSPDAQSARGNERLRGETKRVHGSAGEGEDGARAGMASTGVPWMIHRQRSGKAAWHCCRRPCDLTVRWFVRLETLTRHRI